MTRYPLIILCGLISIIQLSAQHALKDVFKDKFLIGSSINTRQAAGEDKKALKIIRKHFNTVVSENDMKSEVINPAPGVYNWTGADKFVEFGEENDMFIVGHCLIWHSQLAKWFPYDEDGNLVSPQVMRQRMKDYIYTVVGRYKGHVHAWDVVNEAVLDDGSLQPSPFYQALGEEYIYLAFQYAHEADPEAELYINDFGMESPSRRAKYVEIVNNIKQRGLRIDGIGYQGHMGIDYPDFTQMENSIIELSETGVPIMLTELDMGATPTLTHSADVSIHMEYDESLNPYPDGLPADVDSIWNSRMQQVFDICIRHSDVIKRINWWGVSDHDSWKNNWPVPGRTDYPLAFDRNYKMKPFLINIINLIKD